MGEQKAFFWATIVGAIMLAPTEIFDGFSSEYGEFYGNITASTSRGPFFLDNRNYVEK